MRTRGVSAVIATILMLMITIALAGMAYMYISGIFTSSTLGLEVIDAYCTGGTATWTVKNSGTSDIAAASLTVNAVNEACTVNPSAVAIGAGQRGTLTATGCTSGRTHSFRLIGPSNAVELSAYCA